MRTLEEDIDTLTDLDRLRIRSAELRDEGRGTLRFIVETDEEIKKKAALPPSRDIMQDALIVKALSFRGKGGFPPPALVQRLEEIRLEAVLGTGADEVPVLRAARAMQALVAAPDSAFSQSVIFFYYAIIREIYTADAPDWSVGSAKAGRRSTPGAFVTGECARAIMGFADTLNNTGTFINGIRSILEQRERLGSQEIPDDWSAAEFGRLKINFYTTITKLAGNIALKLDPVKMELNAIEEFLNSIQDHLCHAVNDALSTFQEAIAHIRDYHQEEAKAAEKDPRLVRKLERSEGGHRIALNAVQQAEKRALEAQDVFNKEEDFIGALRALEGLFRKSAADVRKLLHPMKGFLSTVLDRELAVASAGNGLGWDPCEMAFAAASYGAISRRWDDERLVRAATHLSKAMFERGRFPVGRPIHSKPQSYRFYVDDGQVIRSFSQILQHVRTVDVDQRLVHRMLLFFEDTLIRSEQEPSLTKWFLEDPHPDSADPWVTAVAVLALDRINRMLDERINHLIFRHFSVREPKEISVPPLESLFYGDYGLRRAPAEDKILREESIAIVLEKMRAHVVGVLPPDNAWDPLYSIVLHGPPGTGKTTLAESLAVSCKVPLVELTPSDLAAGGGDAIERRTRAVFKALSLLTRAVIIFDEFDPVLRKRNLEEKSPTPLSFLTPGMLPKLKTLNNTAGRRGVAYVLITNLISILDEAAVRSGRFDRRIGIYPPDLLSRAGRLFSEILQYYREDNGDTPLPLFFEQRFREILELTAGCPMQALAQRGWFVRPKSKPREGTPFHYLLNDTSPKPPAPEKEAGEPRHPSRDSVPAAQREFRQWVWTIQWDLMLSDESKELKKDILKSPPTYTSLQQILKSQESAEAQSVS